MRYMTLCLFQRRHCWWGDKRSTIFSTRPIFSHGTYNNGFNGLPNSKVSDPELRRQEHMFRAVNDQSSHCGSVMSSSPNQVESECIIIDSYLVQYFLHLEAQVLWSTVDQRLECNGRGMCPKCESSTKCLGLDVQYLQQYFYHLG